MKRVVVLGGGESGVGAALLAKKKQYDVFVSDASKIADTFRQELVENEIDFEDGGHTFDKIRTADIIIKSPGIPDHVPLIKDLKKMGLDPISEIEFAWTFCQSKVIAITGSNGKTTTTALIYHLLQNSGLSSKIGGNYGISFARLLLESDIPDVFVLEISSFQLDGIRNFRPDIAILLNITPDHLDRYEYNLDLYADSKFRIAMNQTGKDVFITNSGQEIITKRKPTDDIFKKPRLLYVSPLKVLDEVTNLNGEKYHLLNPELLSVHNRFNAQCAVFAAETIGVSVQHIEDRLASFVNLAHRMEFVRELKGVRFINDSKATNVDSVVQAIKSVEYPVIWIAGGTDKGNDYAELIPLVKPKVKTLICLGVDNEKLKDAFDGVLNNIQETKDINQAVQDAFRLAEGQGTVLLSPACASFDLFKNYIDRGDQFKAAIAALD